MKETIGMHAVAKNGRRRAYFDSKAGVVRMCCNEERPRLHRPFRGCWDRSSPLSWEEFVNRWERRYRPA